MRVADVDGLHAAMAPAGLPATGMPRRWQAVPFRRLSRRPIV